MVPLLVVVSRSPPQPGPPAPLFSRHNSSPTQIIAQFSQPWLLHHHHRVNDPMFGMDSGHHHLHHHHLLLLHHRLLPHHGTKRKRIIITKIITIALLLLLHSVPVTKFKSKSAPLVRSVLRSTLWPTPMIQMMSCPNRHHPTDKD